MNEFEYLIADNYNPAAEVPEGFVTRVIEAHLGGIPLRARCRTRSRALTIRSSRSGCEL